MGKYLKSSSGTGTKICKNPALFSYSHEETTKLNADSVVYRFHWNFDGQTGYASITVKDDKISNESLIYTDDNSRHKFDRPLGLYNDKSLEIVFKQMLESIDISTIGIYTELN